MSRYPQPIPRMSLFTGLSTPLSSCFPIQFRPHPVAFLFGLSRCCEIFFFLFHRCCAVLFVRGAIAVTALKSSRARGIVMLDARPLPLLFCHSFVCFNRMCATRCLWGMNSISAYIVLGRLMRVMISRTFGSGFRHLLLFYGL